MRLEQQHGWLCGVGRELAAVWRFYPKIGGDISSARGTWTSLGIIAAFLLLPWDRHKWLYVMLAVPCIALGERHALGRRV